MENSIFDEGLLTLRDAAEVLKISEQTVRSRIREGKLSYMRDGRKILFSRKQLEDYVNKNTLAGKTE
jgi:excisionase family DNA binding protein